MSDEPMAPAEILETYGRALATPSAPVILDWYHSLPGKTRETLSLEHLHRLAKMLRSDVP